MRRVARVAAQAKINVWLHVGGPYQGTFHEIDTLFQRIDLADLVTVRADEGRERTISVTGPMVPAAGLGPDRKNLAFRAAEEFQARADWPRGFAIEIDKRIPVGGGLGGGSADAGAVLRALNAIAPDPLDEEALRGVALTIGSDVPFLASELVRAWGGGRGEHFRAWSGAPWETFPASPVLLVIPPFGVSTADAYRWLDEGGPRALARWGDDTGSVALRPVESPWDSFDLGNDFEAVVERRYPFIAQARAALKANGARVARMSGSGSTVFGIFDREAPAPEKLGLDALIVPTRTSTSVVGVEVLE